MMLFKTKEYRRAYRLEKARLIRQNYLDKARDQIAKATKEAQEDYELTQPTPIGK